MPPKNTHFPNKQYPPHHHAPGSQHLTPHPQNPTIQDLQYEKPLHQVPWHHVPLIPFQSFHIKCLRTKGFLRHYQPPAYPAHDVKVITRPHIRKNLFKAEKKSNKIYTPPTEPIGQLYE